MSENVAQTVQQFIQHVLAPDVRDLKVTVADLQKQMDQRFDSLQKQIDQRFDAQTKQLEQRFDAQDRVAAVEGNKADAQFKTLIALFGEFKAQSELNTIRTLSQLSERVALLEANR